MRSQLTDWYFALLSSLTAAEMLDSNADSNVIRFVDIRDSSRVYVNR
ncbi:hypothetical protein [Mycolicibacter heraklionensis]|nr:hypothetical protein [Mycolicibacter heraklionensis]